MCQQFVCGPNCTNTLAIASAVSFLRSVQMGTFPSAKEFTMM